MRTHVHNIIPHDKPPPLCMRIRQIRVISLILELEGYVISIGIFLIRLLVQYSTELSIPLLNLVNL